VGSGYSACLYALPVSSGHMEGRTLCLAESESGTRMLGLSVCEQWTLGVCEQWEGSGRLRVGDLQGGAGHRALQLALQHRGRIPRCLELGGRYLRPEHRGVDRLGEAEGEALRGAGRVPTCRNVLSRGQYLCDDPTNRIFSVSLPNTAHPQHFYFANSLN
jgi:hypothetical protein